MHAGVRNFFFAWKRPHPSVVQSVSTEMKFPEFQNRKTTSLNLKQNEMLIRLMAKFYLLCAKRSQCLIREER